MTEAAVHAALVWAVFALAAVTFASLLRLKAPYGRHYPGTGWGPEIPNRTGWIVMELPATLVFACVYALGDAASEPVPLILLGMWQCHYLNRNFIYPLRIRGGNRKMPVLVAFNVLNAYVNARFISHLGEYGVAWLGDPRFLAGLMVFLGGFALNLHSDNILLRLRKPGASGYSIPPGRCIPLRLLPQLSRRAPGVGRLGRWRRGRWPGWPSSPMRWPTCCRGR